MISTGNPEWARQLLSNGLTKRGFSVPESRLIFDRDAADGCLVVGHLPDKAAIFVAKPFFQRTPKTGEYRMQQGNTYTGFQLVFQLDTPMRLPYSEDPRFPFQDLPTTHFSVPAFIRGELPVFEICPFADGKNIREQVANPLEFLEIFLKEYSDDISPQFQSPPPISFVNPLWHSAQEEHERLAEEVYAQVHEHLPSTIFPSRVLACR